MRRSLYLIMSVVLLSFYTTFAQDGPGGVGTIGATGSIGVWLDADQEATGVLSSWSDQTARGNSLSASGGNEPTVVDAAINGHKVVRFDGSDDYMFNTSLANPYDAKTVFVVFSGKDNNMLSQLWGNYRDGEMLCLETRSHNSGPYSWRVGSNAGGTKGEISLDGDAYQQGADFAPATPQWVEDQFHVVMLKRDAVFNMDKHFIATIDEDGTASSHYFTGDIAEVVVYDGDLNEDIERLRVVNYLGRKYGIVVGGFANALFPVDDHENNLLVIGESNSVDFDSNVGDGGAFYIENNVAGDWGVNELIFAGHNGVEHGTTNSDVDAESRWERVWYIDRQGTEAATSINISFGMQDAFGVDNDRLGYTINDYRLLRRDGTSGDFSEVTTVSSVLTDQNKITFEVANANLIDGYYTLGIPGNNQWYSYLPNGDWDNPDTWTSDPSGTLYINDFAQTPSEIDEITILNGKTVNVSANTKTVTLCTIEAGGILDLASTSGHTLSTIAGDGKIRLSSDNFPANTSKSDFEARGTTEYYGASYSLASDETYFNVIIDLDNPTDVLTLTSDITVNGGLTITTGTFQINDNSTNVRTLDINGDLNVSSSGLIDVGTTGAGNTDHTMYLAGGFYNKGTVKFSDVSTYDYDGSVYTAKVDVQFDNEGADQIVYLEGTTQFYTIISDKGPDNTYLLDISAKATANFELFGQNNSTSIDALDLVSGTVMLGSNIQIPVLKTNTQVYLVPAEATLWINNAEVTMNSGNAIVVYGSLKVSGAYSNLTVGSINGITMRETGIFEVEEGTVTINQFRRTISGGTHLGVYRQTGGYVTVGEVNSVNPYTSFHLFDISEPGMSFIMEGGTLHVKRGSENVLGGIYINSNPDKISVTGGTVICETTSSNDFSITTRAPFNNVTFVNTTGVSREFDVITASSNTAHVPTSISDPIFDVYGDFKDSTGNVILDHNGNDIKFYGNVYMGVGSDIVYDAAKQNTTYILGTGSSEINLQYLTGADYETFWRLEIEKASANDTVTLVADEGSKSLTGRDNDLINVQKAFYLNQGVLNQSFYSLALQCDTVSYSGTLGFRLRKNNDSEANSYNDRIRFLDNGDTTYLFDYGSIGVMEIYTNDNVIKSETDFRANSRFYFKSGRFYLGRFKGRVEDIREEFDVTEANFGGCGGCFSVEDMVILRGEASDEGLGLSWGKNSETIIYPIGVGLDGSAKYTPYEVTVSSGTGNKTNYVSIGDEVLPTTVPNGGDILSYYWRLTHGFNGSNNPEIGTITCTYDDVDDDNSAEATFVQGRY